MEVKLAGIISLIIAIFRTAWRKYNFIEKKNIQNLLELPKRTRVTRKMSIQKIITYTSQNRKTFHNTNESVRLISFQFIYRLWPDFKRDQIVMSLKRLQSFHCSYFIKYLLHGSVFG